MRKSLTAPSASFARLMLTFCAASLTLRASTSYVYTMSNAAAGNQILVYSRAADGSLFYQSAFSTGGLGTGYNLGPQGSLITNGQYIFAVNPGSNTISV